ncbi:MAG TPA: hypothetical protein PK014_02295 [Thermoanaerobaculia bacterium]|nr:hypothetical protein [Thermoanaerobaculia bacterium]
MDENRCQICKKEAELFSLKKCPMCHRHFCEACEVKHGGLGFCSRDCGFMFYDPGEDGEGDY